MATSTFVDYYKILEIERDSSMGQIRQAISLQRRTWVKRQQAPSKERQREAEDRVKAIDEAQRILLDPSKRPEYDARLNAQHVAAPTAEPASAQSDDWLPRARVFLDRGDAQSAAYCAKQATELHGNDHEAWSVRANASLAMGHQQDAVFEFNEAIRIKPDVPDYHFDLGCLYESASNWRAAESCYEVAGRLDPRQPVYKVALAGVYLNNNAAGRARPILEKVHAEYPDDADFNDYYAWALNSTTLTAWTRLKDGSYVITRPEQIDLTREALSKALALKFNDSELRGAIQGNLKIADDAAKLKFHFPGWTLARTATMWTANPGCSAIFVAFLFFCIPFFIAGALSAGNAALGIPLVIIQFVLIGKYLAFQPQWKLTHKATKSMQVPGQVPTSTASRSSSSSTSPSSSSSSSSSNGDSSGWL